MVWLTLTWLALIALWGVSERWELGLVRRRVWRGLRARHDGQAVPPLDRADG